MLPVQELAGVGPRRGLTLAHLGLKTVSDLLFYFPRDWENRRETLALDSAEVPHPLVIRGKILKVKTLRASPKLALFRATLTTGEREVAAVWFKHLSHRYDVFAPLKKDLVPGADAWIVGRAEANLLGVREIEASEYYLLSDPRWPLHVNRLVPIYPLTEGMTQRFLRELVHQALALGPSTAAELLPLALLQKRQLLSLPQALRSIHFPQSAEELEAARARMAYEELLLLELAWLLKRRQTLGINKNYRYEIKRSLLTPFRTQLGFELTGAQKRVINEIFADMQKPAPMTRLLQGDVGSGKTVVALSALLLAVENGGQGVFMAPTEILADQHRITLARFLRGLPVRAAMLTSRLSAKEREKTLSSLRRGEIDILIGTHAVLEEDVQFPRLRCAVIDEQHRFGVRQRTTLRQKSTLLDLLVMTATPIPRTLALALYGDLDVSTLDEMPPGKTTARTLQSGEEEALRLLKEEAGAGRQAYIVYPIIEESSRLDLQSAKAEFERLKSGPLAGLRLALIHGALPGASKARIMNEFAEGRWDVLVATPVIEVGIDVPNATVMVIQNADRFGLSSLHQLRGRIGRGSAASTCFLIAQPKTPEAIRRLETMVSTSDGFKIGEEDLKLRGPGEFMGTAQHGELTLKVANLTSHAELVTLARSDAEEILSSDARLRAPEHARLRARLLELYQSQWNSIDLA